MSIKDKLIAAGMDAAEADKIAALLEAQTSEGAATGSGTTDDSTGDGAAAATADDATGNSESGDGEAATTDDTTGDGAAAATTDDSNGDGAAAATTDAATDTATTDDTTDNSGSGDGEAATTDDTTDDGAATAATDDTTDDAKPDLAGENAKLRAQLINAQVRSCALEMGVRAERVGTLNKLVDVSTLDATSDNLRDLVLEAVRTALEEVPEFADGGMPGTGMLGNHARMASKPLTAFERGLLG